MSIANLQAQLDASIGSSNQLSQSLFDHQMTAEQVAEFITANKQIEIATVFKNGLPHLATARAVCVEGEIHFSVSDGAAMGKNLERDNHLAFSITDNSRAVMGRGTGRKIGRGSGLLPGVVPTTWDGDVYAIDITKVFAG